MVSIKSALFALAILSVFLLSGCLSSEGLSGFEGTGTSSSGISPATPPSAYPGGSADYGTSGSSGSVQSSEKMIIKTGNARIEVPEGTIDSRYSQFKDLVSSYGGEITDSTYYETQSGKSYSLTVRLDPTKFDDFSSSLSDIGTVKSLTSSGEDVTTQYIDITAKLQNLNASRNRLLDLYNKTDKIADIIQIEQELTDLQYQIDSATQQKLYLERQSSKATMSVTIVEPAPALDTTILDPIGQLANIFLEALVMGLMLIVGILGFGIPVAIALVLLYLVVKVVFLNKRNKPNEKK